MKILADFTGYGSAMAALLGGFLVVALLAVLALLQFARSCHILLKNRLTVSDIKSVSIWTTVVWGGIGFLIILGPSFIYGFSVTSHPQNIFRFSLGVLAIVWWKRLEPDSPLRIEKFLILWWGIFAIAAELFSMIRYYAFGRSISPDIREVYYAFSAFERYFDTIAMLLVVLLIYSQSINTSITKRCTPSTEPPRS